MLDLQMHSSDSDGTWPWDKILNRCLEMGLTAFSITDHDTIARRKDILEWAKVHKAMAIPGVELSTVESEESVHLLGYFLEGPLKNLEKMLSGAVEARNDRNKKILKKLQAMGYQVSFEDLASGAACEPVGRPHIARLLMEKGYVKTIREAFHRFLSRKGSAYYPKDDIRLEDAITLLHEAGAVSVVAHPGLLQRSPHDLEQSIRTWADWGLDGIEVYYPSHTSQQLGFLMRLTDKFGLVRTGGSDFHGDNKPHIQIGIGSGDFKVPDELLAPLLKKRDLLV